MRFSSNEKGISIYQIYYGRKPANILRCLYVKRMMYSADVSMLRSTTRCKFKVESKPYQFNIVVNIWGFFLLLVLNYLCCTCWKNKVKTKHSIIFILAQCTIFIYHYLNMLYILYPKTKAETFNVFMSLMWRCFFSTVITWYTSQNLVKLYQKLERNFEKSETHVHVVLSIQMFVMTSTSRENWMQVLFQPHSELVEVKLRMIIPTNVWQWVIFMPFLLCLVCLMKIRYVYTSIFYIHVYICI